MIRSFLPQDPEPCDEERDFQAWLQAVDHGYRGTFNQYRALFDEEGELV